MSGQAEVDPHAGGTHRSKLMTLLHLFGLFVLLSLTIVQCLGTVLAVVFVGGGLAFDPNDYIHLQDWTMNIGRTAQGVLSVVVLNGVFLGIAAAISVLAAWRRNLVWGVGGALSGVMLFAALMFASLMGFEQLSWSIESAHDRIGRVELLAPGADQRTVPKDQITAISEEEARGEIKRLIGNTAQHATGPFEAVDRVTGEVAEMNLEDPPLRFESCYPNPGGEIGSKLSVQFTVPSDAAGDTVRALTKAWSDAGYPSHDQVRDQRLMGSDRLAIGLASINDRYTIDGKLWVSMESRCATAEGSPGDTE